MPEVAPAGPEKAGGGFSEAAKLNAALAEVQGPPAAQPTPEAAAPTQVALPEAPVPTGGITPEAPTEVAPGTAPEGNAPPTDQQSDKLSRLEHDATALRATVDQRGEELDAARASVSGLEQQAVEADAAGEIELASDLRRQADKLQIEADTAYNRYSIAYEQANDAHDEWSYLKAQATLHPAYRDRPAGERNANAIGMRSASRMSARDPLTSEAAPGNRKSIRRVYGTLTDAEEAAVNRALGR